MTILKLTTDEQALYDERVAIMLTEFNPAGLTDEQVESATVAIDGAATQQIRDRRERLAAGQPKKQAGFEFRGGLKR